MSFKPERKRNSIVNCVVKTDQRFIKPLRAAGRGVKDDNANLQGCYIGGNAVLEDLGERTYVIG
jgi:hypothetical protein